METKGRVQEGRWHWILLLSAVILNVCLPSLVSCYGVLLVHYVQLEAEGVSLAGGFAAPTIFLLVFGLSQCWCRDAADSWGGRTGYRVMAALGLTVTATGILVCAFTPHRLHPYIYGVLGGFGSSLTSAQVDAVLFDMYDRRLELVRGLCYTGQAVGLAIFPHILSALVQSYGYPWMYLVLAGILLQTLPFILILKVDPTLRRPTSFSRYSDLGTSYTIFNNDSSNNYELQLHDLSKKCWKSPSDDNLHSEGSPNIFFDDDITVTITPPPSPEEKRRNLFGVEILPEIPEESEEEDEEQSNEKSNGISQNKKKLNDAIKRYSHLGDDLEEQIAKQIRRDSQSDRDLTGNSYYSEIEVTYDNISPVTDIHREKLYNSFSFRCQSAYVKMRRRISMPSYKIYRLKRRLTFCMYNINDTFVKPLSRSLLCWRFYPAMFLFFVKLGLTAITLPLVPMIGAQVQPPISISESNFMMTLYAFTWICFLISTPWLAQTPKRNYKYVTVVGLFISTAACFVLSDANNHDTFSIGCVVAGFGYGAICACWETAVQDFVGAHMWPKIHSTLETLSSVLLAAFVVGLSFLIQSELGLQHCIFIFAGVMSIVTFIWFIIASVSIYINKMQSFRLAMTIRI